MYMLYMHRPPPFFPKRTSSRSPTEGDVGGSLSTVMWEPRMTCRVWSTSGDGLPLGQAVEGSLDQRMWASMKKASAIKNST